MAVEALDTSLNVSLVTVGDRLFRAGQKTGAGDEYGSDDAHGHYQHNEQEPANRLARLGSYLTDAHGTLHPFYARVRREDDCLHGPLLGRCG